LIRRRRLGRLLTTLCCTALACSSQDLESRTSAARVARAIEVLRAAPNPSKAGVLADLVKLRCLGVDVCETRDVCSDAYRVHVDAVALTQAAKLQISDGKAPEAAKLLVSAEEKLSEAGRRVARCAEREASLRHRYKL
jgi:hypothetical protein